MYYICELTFDIIFFVFFLLYVISFCIYNKEPKMFEVLNLLIFIIFPLINLSVIYGFTWYKGFKVILTYFNLKCDCDCNWDCDKLPNNDDELKQLVYYDKFEEKIRDGDSYDSFRELEPVKLFMYIRKIDRWFKVKFVSTILIMVFILTFFPLYFWDFYTFLYLFFFFAFSFPLSLAVPNHLFVFINLKDCFKSLCCCCKCCLKCKLNQNIMNIGEKFKGLKYWVYIIQTLLNLSIIGLVIVVLAISSSSVSTIDEIFKSKDYFNNIEIGDLTEQTFSRNYVKSPMCFTTIHHLNFIQLTSLAQAAYLNEGNDIETAKNEYYSKSIFKDPNIEIEKMEFLTKENNNIVILRTDIKIKDNNKGLIIFSIRGSTSWRDWWLDLEMYCPSTIFTLIKMIPLIQRSESISATVISSFLTLPLSAMDGISLLNQYSETAKEKIEPIIKENQDKDILFVGHSLGGGLSKYIGFYFKKQSFSVSGPGVTPLEYKDQFFNGYNKFFRSNFIDIIPDNDLIPRLEVSGGIKYRILCQKNPLKCHSIVRTLCMMGLMCEQEEYTKQLCLSMIDIGKEEYDSMREFKNGEDFCNNYIFDKDGNYDTCKNAKVTSSEYKCYYAHLQYLKDGEIRNDYKCLQFNKFEKENYKKALESKYPEEQRIIEILPEES